MRIGSLKHRVVGANHTAVVMEVKCRVNVRILSSEGGKLVDMVCELIALAATSLMLCD
jgi:hypothetical protein